MKRFLDWKGHAFLALPARLYLGGVFLLACWHKILDPRAFAVDVATYQMVPLQLLNLMAITLPWIELAAGLLLVVGLRARAAALMTAAMMVVFMLALGSALARGLDMSCGCFASQGAEADPISWKTMARDAGWLLLALYVVFFDRSPLGIDRLLDRHASRAAAASP